MKKRILLLLASSLFFLSFKASLPLENICNIMFPRGGDEDWGIGAYHLLDSTSVTLFEKNLSKEYGKLCQYKYRFTINCSFEDRINYRDLDYFGHSSSRLLKVKNIDDDFVQVLWKTKKGGLFIRKKDLERQGARFFTYQELLFQGQSGYPVLNLLSKPSNIGVNLNKSCLNLRENSTIQSRKIDCILGNDWKADDHYHMTILDTYDTWAKVKVTKFVSYYNLDDPEGCSFKPIPYSTGWVKAIDDSGFPNIWYSVSSY